MIPEGAIISGFISKIINDFVDVTKDKIKKADSDRKAEYQSFETRIYQVIIDAINEFTYGKYKNQDILYDAAEDLLNGFKNGEKDNITSVKSGLNNFVSNVDKSECERFIRVLCHEISKENNFDVYKEIVLINQGQETKYNHEVFQRMDKKLDYLSQNITEKNKDFQENDNLQGSKTKQKVKSRTQEYADKWDANMFLNDFDEWDENAGVNVTLSDIYIDRHLPYFKYGHNEKESDNLDVLLSQYIMNTNENRMLLILGQPGIGKSTLITWITVNFVDRINDILVYRFASDLENIDWKDGGLSNRVLEELGLNHNDLNGKILILDGFDEVSVEEDRIRVLDNLYGELIYKKNINNFSLIITCRENYIQGFERVKCKYIILQPWNDTQIRSFCNIFQEKTKGEISGNTIEKLIENKEILGIPLILYMVLALNISVEKEGSIVDIYDKIFSLDGGIYDRCIENRKFADAHRIGEIKEYVHQISRDIAIWIFENKPEEASIPQKEYKKICIKVMQESEQENADIKQDFKIGGFFKQVRHCEGLDAEELYFVHRSIYEYFVAEAIYNSIKNAIISLTEEGQRELAGNIAFYLKKGKITYTIGSYLYYKIIKCYNKVSNEKKLKFYPWWESTVALMIENGMFFFTNKSIKDYQNIIFEEANCFLNMLEILRLFLHIGNKQYILENIDYSKVRRYVKYCIMNCEICNFSYLNLKLMDFRFLDLSDANLTGTNLLMRI